MSFSILFCVVGAGVIGFLVGTMYFVADRVTHVMKEIDEHRGGYDEA